MWFDVIYYVVSVAIVWWLAIEAFKNRERALRNAERALAMATIAKDTMDSNDRLIAANEELLTANFELAGRLKQYEQHPSPFEKPFTNAHSGMGVKDNVEG